MSTHASAVLSEGSSKGRRAERPLIAGFDVHSVGVNIDSAVDQRTWYEFGKILQQTDYARDWIIADWLAFGKHRYGDKVYQQAANLLGKAARTWEDYAYIARNVKISERSEVLPTLVHKPIARFSDDPDLQRKLIGIAEQHGLSKAVFQEVVELYLEGKRYAHLLSPDIPPMERARMRATKERERVLKRASTSVGSDWIDYAREQAQGWAALLEELETLSSARN